jgi:hypothetical protein
MKFILPLILFVCVSGCFFTFGGEDVDEDAIVGEWGTRAVTLEYESDNPDLTWHDRYVMDNCARCPDCCVSIPVGDSLDDDE